jgi:hypothetical protein
MKLKNRDSDIVHKNARKENISNIGKITYDRGDKEIGGTI